MGGRDKRERGDGNRGGREKGTGEVQTIKRTNERTNERTNKLYAHAQINVRLPLCISQRQCIKYVATDYCTTFGANRAATAAAMNDLVLYMVETNKAI